MTVGDFVKINGSTLNLLAKFDVKTTDVRFVKMFNEFNELAQNNKVSYVVAFLSEKYNISEASIYRILKRFKKTI